MFTPSSLYELIKKCTMSKDETDLIGKPIKDLYGTYVGKVVGTLTDIDGSIQTVGADCGSDGLVQIPFEQLVVQNDIVIFIPKWRLDAQRLLRQKGLTLRRMKALLDIVSSNDEMKEDAELINEKYKSKLLSIEEAEKEIRETLDARTNELSEQIKSIKILIFDARVQYKSNEISETKFEHARTQATSMMEHSEHEKSEIANIKHRIDDLSMESIETPQPAKEQIQSAAVTYLNQEPVQHSTQDPVLPEPPVSNETKEEPPVQEESSVQEEPVPIGASVTEEPTSDWLNRMESQ